MLAGACDPGELLGLARWDQQFKGVGLSEGAVEALLREAEATLHKLSELVALTRAFNTGIVSLCKWLERLTMRLCSDSGPTCLSADDALAIAKFIRVHLSHDRVGAVLDGAEGAGMGLAPIDAEKLNAGLMAKLGMAMPAATTTWRVSLAAQLARLQDAADFAFGETKQSISSKLSVVACVRIAAAAAGGGRGGGAGEVPSRVAMAAIANEEGSKGGSSASFVVAMREADEGGGADRLGLLRLSPLLTDDEHGSSLEHACLGLMAGEQGLEVVQGRGDRAVVDLGFYGTRVCVLVTSAGESAASAAGHGGVSHLLRIPCSTFKWGGGVSFGRKRCLDAAAAARACEGGAMEEAPDGVEARQLGTSEVVRVAVNARRGLASVLTTKPWRMTLLDMEDDGDEDGEGAESTNHSMDQS